MLNPGAYIPGGGTAILAQKNSKWLQENLSDMDTKVKLMIKLLEEDADSFARRAEMYYKKRPELMKLVEEFYRAYRALAERYDHATGALRQAHRTIAEAFPNQVPFALIDDPPSSSSAVESEPHTPDMPPPIRAFVEPDDLQKGSLSQSAHFHANKNIGAYSEENDALNSRRGLKQLNEMLTSGEATSHPKFAEGKIIKELNFQEVEEKMPEHRLNDVPRNIKENDIGNKEVASDKKSLQDEVSHLHIENQNLRTQIKSQLEAAEKAETEIHRLQESLSRLEAEKETALLQCHESIEKISNLEMEISHAQADNKKLKSEMLITLASLESAEGQCRLLETEKQALEMELKALAQKTNQQELNLLQKQDEMENLKHALQDEHIQHTQAATALQSLEKIYSESLEKLRISALESQSQVDLLRDMEFRKHTLEEDIQQVKEENSSLKNELKLTQEELEKLNISIHDEHCLSAQPEEALQSLQKLHSHSPKEIKMLMFDLQTKIEILKSIDLKKHSLEEEVQQLCERNENLNNQVLSSTLTIKDLQQEILSLKETRLEIENEVEQLLHGNKVLQQEVHYLKEENANLDLKHQCITEQIEAVGLNKESFRASIKELQDGNAELKVLCEKREDENVILLEKLENTERVIVENALLETSLSDATVELETLREKVKMMEEYSESLNNKISDLILERSSLVFQLEAISENLENLSENNAFLEKTLSEANVELEGLRGRLKSLEESSQYLLNENSNLQSEKNTLVLQVENIGTGLENMKRSCAELEERHLHLEQEKESTLLLVSELQNLLKLEKQEYEAFILSSNNRLATLTDTINLLQEEGQIRDEELDSVQNKLLNFQIEAFILQRCLLDSKENNLSLARECHKHLEASKLATRSLSQLETENLGQKEMIASISKNNKKVTETIQMVSKTLGVKSSCTSDETVCKADCQHILGQLKEIQSFISDILDENQILLLEKSVYFILQQQLGFDLIAINSERNVLSIRCKTAAEQLLELNSEKNELLQITEQLRRDILAGSLREDNLKAEIDTLSKQLLDLIEGHKKLQDENCNLVEEKQSVEKNIFNLRNEIKMLEEENNALLSEAVTLSFLSLILEKFGAERAVDLEACRSDLASLHDVNNDLKKNLSQMIQNIVVVEAENMLLKDSAVKLEAYKDRMLLLQDDLHMARSALEQLNHQVKQLSHQIETEKGLSSQKEVELTEMSQKLKVKEYEKSKLFRDLEGMKIKFDEAMYAKEELDKSICMLMECDSHKEKEIADLCEANQMLSTDVNTLSRELAVLRSNKEHLTSELAYEIKRYEEEVATLLHDIHVSTVHAGVFEEKVLELIGECESLEIIAIVQRKAFEEQITLNNSHADDLIQKLEPLECESEKLKAQLNACLSLVSSLQSSTSALENKILSFVNHRRMDNNSTQDLSLVIPENEKSCRQLSESPNNTEADGMLRMQKLQVKIDVLQSVLVEYRNILMRENPDVDTKSAAMEIDIEVLTPEKPLVGEEDQENRCTIMEHEEEVGETSSKNLEQQSGGAEKSEGTNGLMMKDIQLDHAYHDVGNILSMTGRVESSVNVDQMVAVWGTAEGACNNQVHEVPSVATEDMGYHQTEAAEEQKTQFPSKLVAGKEASIDKLEVPRKVKESHQDWNKKVLECLASDAHRLSILQKSVQELKKMLENSEKSGPSTSMKYDTVRWQLKETEEAISQLFDINGKLTKKAEDCCSSSDSKVGEQDEAKNQRKKRISDRARRGSEKIGRMELELQRIQYVILKLDEEHESSTKAAHRRSKVILRDYLYGRRESQRQKKGHFCGCIQTKTGSD